MPDTVEPVGSGRYPADMESRVAVLEQIARSLLSGQERIERRLDAIGRRSQSSRRLLDISSVAAEQRADFRWLLGIMLGGFGAIVGVMAHGFHWL